eukprot:gene18860-3481_t
MMAASEEDDDSMIVGQPTRPKTPEVPEPEPEPELNIYQMCQRGQLEKIMDAAANGMDLKGRDDENISTLHWASINGKTKVVEYLLQEGVEVDAIGGELNGTPLQWAV